MAKSFSDRAMDAWWGKLAGGLLILGFAVYLFVQIGRVESGELESLRVNRLVKFGYGVGGKWVVSVPLGLGGLALAGWGVSQAVRGRE